jgi:hypothetical protein
MEAASSATPAAKEEEEEVVVVVVEEEKRRRCAVATVDSAPTTPRPRYGRGLRRRRRDRRRPGVFVGRNLPKPHSRRASGS